MSLKRATLISDSQEPVIISNKLPRGRVIEVLKEYFSFNTSLKDAAKNNYMGIPMLSYSSSSDYEFDGLSGSNNIYIKKNGIEISFSMYN